MNRIKIAATVLIVLAVLAMGFVSASGTMVNQGSFTPYAVSSGQNLTIYANGSVSNNSLVTVNGNEYTLTGSLAGNLLVNDSNIVVSGNGYSVDGYLGIQLINVSGVTLTNFGAKYGTNSTYLTVQSAGNVTLIDSTVASQAGGNVYVKISFAGNVNLTGNTINLTTLNIQSVNNFVLSKNSMEGGSVSISSANQVNMTSNTFFSTLPAFVISHANSMQFENNNAQFATSVTNNNEFLQVSYVNSVKMLNDNLTAFSSIGQMALDVWSVNSMSINNVTINGFSGVYFDDVASLSVLDSAFSNMTANYGFDDEYGQSLTVSHSVFSIIKTEIYQYDSMYVYQVVNVSITNSVLLGGTAADLETITHLTLLNSTITTTVGAYSAYAGIDLYEITKGTVHNNTIYWASNSNDYAILVGGFSNVNISDNTIYSMAPGGGNTATGIYAEDLLDSSFTDNVIQSYNGSSNFTTGIFLDSVNNVVVSGNTVNATNTALRDEYGVNNTMTDNTLSATSYGIYVDYSLNFNVSMNTDNGSDYALYSEGNANGLFWKNTMTDIFSHGMVSLGDSSVVSIDNILAGTGQPLSVGVYASETSGNDFVSNSFTGFSLGIETVHSSGLSFTNNEFQGRSLALLLENSSSLSITGNTFAYFSNLMNLSGNISLVSVYHNNFVNYSQVIQSVANGTVLHGLILDMGSTVGGNFWSNYSGPYSNGLGTVAYSVGYDLADNHPLQNPWEDPVITFVATGLAPNTQWSVTVGSATYTTGGSSINVPVVNGAYGTIYYSVGGVAGYSPTASSGTVYFSGSSVTAFVNFVQVKYGVTFSTTGLPSNTSVSLKIGNATYSVSGSLTVNLPNGTYSYTVSLPANFTTSETTGTFTVDGSTVAVSIPFRTTGYTVTFKETGLSGSFTWTVTVNGQTYNGTGSSISVPALQPGTYNYTVQGPSGYTYTGTGNISVSENQTVLVLFSHSGAGAGLLAAAIVGSLAAGLIAMLLVALFAPQVIDSLRDRIKKNGSNGSGTKNPESKPEQKTNEKPKSEGNLAEEPGEKKD